MNDTFFIAALMAILAFAGLQPGRADAGRMCKTGLLAPVTSACWSRTAR